MEVINVIGELSFDAPLAPVGLAKLQRSDGWCFGNCRVRLVRLFLARNRKRAVLVFEAPDAESVRQAFRHTQTHFDDIWPCAVDAGTHTEVETGIRPQADIRNPTPGPAPVHAGAAENPAWNPTAGPDTSSSGPPWLRAPRR